MIYVIGDSHTRSFAFNKNFTPLFLGQGKEINFSSDSNLEKVKIATLNSLKWISEKDSLIVFIGEPDTRFYLNAGWYPWDNSDKIHIDDYKKNVSQSVKRYQLFLELLLKKFNGNVFVLNVIPSNRELQNLIVDEFNAQIKKYCNLEKLNFIEINQYIYKDESHKDVKDEYISDHVHLNNKIQVLVQGALKGFGVDLKDDFNTSVKWDNTEIQQMFVYDEKFGCYKMKEQNISTDINDIIIEKNTPIESIVSKLKDNGVLIIENYASKEDVSILCSEFKNILEQSSSEWLEVRPYSLGKAALLSKNNTMKAVVPSTYKFFDNPFMQKITDKYLGQGFNSNQKIFVVKDVVGTSHHANDLHFDVARTLKFFLYLTDTTEKNGAFRCVVGSNKESEKIRKENPDALSYENREFSRKLPFGPEHTVSIDGKAGSLIIFDTNVFHQAGKVTEGERWVMRGQTEPVPEPKKKLSLIQRIKNKLS